MDNMPPECCVHLIQQGWHQRGHEAMGHHPGRLPSPVGEIFQFRLQLNLYTMILHVIPTTFTCPDDLLDFAHRKGRFFSEDPKFSTFSWKEPNTPTFLFYNIKSKFFGAKRAEKFQFVVLFGNSTPLSGHGVADPGRGAFSSATPVIQS